MPVLPLVYVGLTVVKRVKALWAPDWMLAGPGRVFFLSPDGPLASFLWDCTLSQQMFVGQFFFTGTHPDAISHTWQDTILTKHFWRSLLSRTGACVPRELGTWDGKALKQTGPGIKGNDLVVKLPDSYLGIGDAFWRHGKGKDYQEVADLTKRLEKEYAGKEAIVLDLVRPHPKQGVHSLDIITIRAPGGDVKVLSVLLWTDCSG